MIALVDYKAGNLTSVRKALAEVGAEVVVPETPADLQRAAGVIVPGVGHFAATRALQATFLEVIRSLVSDGRPLLGICLGMQWLYEGSDEDPQSPGLGLLAGKCYRLQGRVGQERLRPQIKVPHVGWNSLAIARESVIAAGVADGAQVYFTHSYVAPMTFDTVASTEHGEPFAAIIERGHVSGAQFHPEKSGDVGLRILRNFVETVRQRRT